MDVETPGALGHRGGKSSHGPRIGPSYAAEGCNGARLCLQAQAGRVGTNNIGAVMRMWQRRGSALAQDFAEQPELPLAGGIPTESFGIAAGRLAIRQLAE